MPVTVSAVNRKDTVQQGNTVPRAYVRHMVFRETRPPLPVKRCSVETLFHD
jgi:hypothetical protein